MKAIYDRDMTVEVPEFCVHKLEAAMICWYGINSKVVGGHHLAKQNPLTTIHARMVIFPWVFFKAHSKECCLQT